MATITASQVNELRQATSAGMMDCKKALQECDGDMETAVDFLRKKGQKVATKRSDRDAKEGLVIAKSTEDNKLGVAVMFNCETDFVAKNQDFIDFANMLVDKAITDKTASLADLKATLIDGKSIEDEITNLTGKMGEKLELGAYEKIESEKVFVYNHQGNRLATIIGFSNDSAADQMGREVAMQIAAMNPVAVDKDDVSQDVIKKEIEIGMDQARQEGKPEAMLEKIATGKLNKFFKENTLLNQQFVRDTKVTVKEYIGANGTDLKVTGFKRVMLGE